MATAAGWENEALIEALQHSLRVVWPGLHVDVRRELDSTNTQLLQRTADNRPCLLVAEHQTQGRGRRGRPWLSTAGASLTFSLGLPLAPLRWEGLSLAVGLALADALEPPPLLQPGQPPRLMLKWPNDLWLMDAGPGKTGTPGRKLGGVLVETTLRGGQRYCVVGVGLNIRPQEIRVGGEAAAGLDAVPDAALDHGYACLQELQPGTEAAHALACLALPLAQALRSFERAGFAPLQTGFAARDLLRGRAVSTHGNPALQGRAMGVAVDGALQVQTDDGVLQRVHSGEVSVRMMPRPGHQVPTRPQAPVVQPAESA